MSKLEIIVSFENNKISVSPPLNECFSFKEEDDEEKLLYDIYNVGQEFINQPYTEYTNSILLNEIKTILYHKVQSGTLRELWKL